MAAASAPVLTATQNWCWKPFAITGMYILSPSVLGAGSDVLGAGSLVLGAGSFVPAGLSPPPPQAARARTMTIARSSARIFLVFFILSSSS